MRRLYRRLAGKYENLEVVPFTDRVPEYMARAHLMLSKSGGITAFEAIAARLPMLAWEPFLEQERRNTRFLVERELGRVAGREPEQCLQDIKDLIYDTHSLSRMAPNMGGVKAMPETSSPVTHAGRYLFFCSSVPFSKMGAVHRDTWADSATEVVVQTRAISSTAMA